MDPPRFQVDIRASGGRRSRELTGTPPGERRSLHRCLATSLVPAYAAPHPPQRRTSIFVAAHTRVVRGAPSPPPTALPSCTREMMNLLHLLLPRFDGTGEERNHMLIATVARHSPDADPSAFSNCPFFAVSPV